MQATRDNDEHHGNKNQQARLACATNEGEQRFCSAPRCPLNLGSSPSSGEDEGGFFFAVLLDYSPPARSSRSSDVLELALDNVSQ